MKFTVSSMKLFNHLSGVSRVINAKNTLPILDCFLFNQQEGTLKVTGSDSETTLVTSIEVDSFEENGVVCLGAKTLLDSLKEIPDQPITFNINLSTFEVIVNYQNGKFNLTGQSADNYPVAPALAEESIHLAMDPVTLNECVSRSLFAVEEDELHPIMNGIYFDINEESITIVASDGHKLVRNCLKNAHGESVSSFILPKKPATLLKSLLAKEEGEEVKIDFDSRNIVITTTNSRMTCRQIEGRYPQL